MKDVNKPDKLTVVLFMIYLLAMVWIIIFKFNVHFTYLGNERSVNLVPYNEPLILNGKTDFGEIILNVLIFLPLGVYSGILFRKWIFRKQLILFFLASFIIELSQYIFGVGASDITDIINNTLGGIIGLLMFKGIEKVFGNGLKAQKFINILAITATVLMILFLLLLKIKRLWIFRM